MSSVVVRLLNGLDKMPDERDDRLEEIKKILYAFKAEVSLRGAFQAAKKRTAFSVKNLHYSCARLLRVLLSKCPAV